ncbi:ChaN family lipoprotein [Shimia sp. R10_1]|uniref:ChaN family lipoprotein n=1 Tax=Shimia sp. R10_1 TaxID=2821095 RepID=UPI001ADBD2FC|nr:ChaN family lipoprotein [Shimia sp. R10_1]MBO9475229.1 ChaN family lipoprotein [Shimia sp. R10_1]
MKSGNWFDPRTGAALHHHDVIAQAAQAQAVLLGEQHDKAENHRWQMHVAAGLLALRSDLVMGFEMFPKRLNPVLQDWVDGKIAEPEFAERVEWGTVWGFDISLYMPLFHFCRDFGIPMLGLNCRRGLVTEVGKEGWDAIPEPDREGLTQAAPASAAYRKYLFDITGGAFPNRKATSPEDPQFDRFVRAQQTWDRAFACRIAEIALSSSAPLVIGIIGRGHLEHRYGTPSQLVDQGVNNCRVLLPHAEGAEPMGDIADALCQMPAAS